MWPTEQHQVLLVTVKDNSKREKKEPCKAPIFHNKYIADLNEKSEISNSFIANQCCLIPNNSILPSELKGSRAVLWRTFPKGQFPERTFFERTVPRMTFRRSDISRIFFNYLNLYLQLVYKSSWSYWIPTKMNCWNSELLKSIRDSFLKISCKFQSIFKKFSWKFIFRSIATCGQ